MRPCWRIRARGFAYRQIGDTMRATVDCINVRVIDQMIKCLPFVRTARSGARSNLTSRRGSARNLYSNQSALNEAPLCPRAAR